MQTNSPSKQQIKLLKYLDEFDKQINSRRNTANGLQQQLASLSRAYNQAQQKLLDTERVLMSQSILLQKQRSVIDIYKCALNEELDQQGLLYFLQQLEQDQSNREIYQDIAQIRSIISRRQLQGNRRVSQEQKLKELKKQLLRIQEDHSVIVEQNEKINSSNYQMQMENQKLKEQVQKFRNRFVSMEKEMEKVSKLLEEERRNNQKFKLQIENNRRHIDQLTVKEKELSQIKQKSQEISRILKVKLGIASASSQNQNNSTIINTTSLHEKPRQDLFEDLQGKLSQLIKYKQQYKKLKEQGTNNDFLKRQINLLKLFLSEQALHLFKEFQMNKQDCIETQLRNLALLERSKLIRLQECQRDVWKYRIQLMMEQQDTDTILKTKMTATVKSTLTTSQGPPAIMLQTLQPDPISQFNS